MTLNRSPLLVEGLKRDESRAARRWKKSAKRIGKEINRGVNEVKRRVDQLGQSPGETPASFSARSLNFASAAHDDVFREPERIDRLQKQQKKEQKRLLAYRNAEERRERRDQEKSQRKLARETLLTPAKSNSPIRSRRRTLVSPGIVTNVVKLPKLGL